MSHGLGEHLEWYNELGMLLAENGYMVFGHDHLGHGLSEGSRGYIETFDTLISHVMSHVSKIKMENQGVPCFIFGHSMGGNVALRWAKYSAQKGILGKALTLTQGRPSKWGIFPRNGSRGTSYQGQWGDHHLSEANFGATCKSHCPRVPHRAITLGCSDLGLGYSAATERRPLEIQSRHQGWNSIGNARISEGEEALLQN